MLPSGKGGKKVYQFRPNHITKMTAMLICGKTLKILQNHRANCLETWYAASGELVLKSLYIWWPWVDLDLFYGKVRFGPLGFWMKKCIFGCFCALWYNNASTFNLNGIREVKVIWRAWPKITMSVIYHHFQRASHLKLLGQFCLNFICSLIVEGKAYIQDHMSKMAAMPLFGKNLENSSPEQLGRLPWNLVCCIWGGSPFKFI